MNRGAPRLAHTAWTAAYATIHAAAPYGSQADPRSGRQPALALLVTGPTIAVFGLRHVPRAGEPRPAGAGGRSGALSDLDDEDNRGRLGPLPLERLSPAARGSSAVTAGVPPPPT
ncbi:hypothetical protein AB0C50_19530 [Micromonospora taraxaci]|uniref:hypothetical protein n=1 Tax=Micromonospora taraxaci TaxID=1316803 RepID=UPI0033CAC0EC